MNWQQFLTEGDKAVKIVRDGLRKRNINAGEPILTIFNTDEDIPIYDNNENKLFWISVKSVSGSIQYPITQIPSHYKG
jgi:hypothetical protein